VDGNPNSYNLGLQGRGSGAYIELKLNTEAPPGVANAPAVIPGSGSDSQYQQLQYFNQWQQQLQQEKPRRLLVVLFNRGVSEPRNRMGVAQLTCVSGCQCAPMWLVGYKQGDTAAALRVNSTQVRQWLETGSAAVTVCCAHNVSHVCGLAAAVSLTHDDAQCTAMPVTCLSYACCHGCQCHV
jgi:hypothetical protein